MPNTKIIPLDYFYKIFQEKFLKSITKNEQTQFKKDKNKLSTILPFYSTTSISKEECLSIYDKILFDICTTYTSITNTNIDTTFNNSLEFVNLILYQIEETPYKESFLLSLQFIYQDILNCLEKGFPILTSKEILNASPALKVTTNSNNQIINLEATNINLLEQTKIMTKLLIAEMNHQLGPIPKVLHRICKN